MKIAAIETLQADAGWRMFSFLKVTTDDGVVGWSEFNESFGSAGLSDVIRALTPVLIGRDPRRFEQITQHLHVLTRQSRGGLNQQAIAAIENALLDVAGKAYGVPVCALFGGPIRERIPVYWSHFGTYRVRSAALMGVPPLRNHDDLARHAREVRDRGFRALKTNILPLAEGTLSSYVPGFGRTAGWPELNWDNRLVQSVKTQLAAIRGAVGGEMGIHLDINFNFKTEGFKRIADAVADANLTWLEIDTHDAPALAEIKRGAPCPIASCETLHGRREFKPFLDLYATDVAIIDVIWNGLVESAKIAAMADVHEINVAPHNFYGHLCSAISAHFSAIVPNFRVMELDLDSAPWRDEFYTSVPVIENGDFILPTGPGWGIDVNEKAVRARPPKS
ncbi:mandelate racemase/muconate lactonizing enzyme family protein [Rhodopila sp.]|jgi:L-alanine-DL-glutamate epimerase-like enolase superfamily enzyme|uniref:mandelate racemase/muconate lactonizing enzyme family protein n=1 Tax=Rhodopila sp. TaxID=2480087 RepID=UPI002CE0966C|nr:mandelate racemase/muconate lactonizing enzyme family protein [Rhodopila sp.]HVZ09015.1 mandelate racemase/muconate lactonizing enzyme family protein [Rhodopila sp.]